MKSSRIFFLAIIAIIIAQNLSISQQYWVRQPSPVNYQLSKCFFTDSLYGWAAGDSGAMIHTTNGGLNWEQQNSGITLSYFEDLFFLNRRLGWALSNDFYFTGTIMVRTIDGGLTWTNSRYNDTTLILKSVFYTDSLNGYMGDLGGRIIKTTDGGFTWSHCHIDSAECFSFSIQKINFVNSLTGYICGGHIDIVGMVMKTTNAGANWHPYCLSPEPMNDIVFQGGKIYGVGGDPEYGAMSVMSSDSGKFWSYDAPGLFGIAQQISFRTPAEAWAPLGYSMKWMVSNDSGSPGTWFTLDTPDSIEIYSVHFNSPANGWAFGSRGAIFKYNTSVIGVSGPGNNVPASYRLFQNYPNPFNPRTIIKFEIPKSGEVRIVLFDVQGREVKTLYSAYAVAGGHEIRFDGSEFATGIYFYRISAGDFTKSMKLVLLK